MVGVIPRFAIELRRVLKLVENMNMIQQDLGLRKRRKRPYRRRTCSNKVQSEDRPFADAEPRPEEASYAKCILESVAHLGLANVELSGKQVDIRFHQKT